ncbi:MAG: Si-specific NAD(P)(+) transhydrogenase [Spirochaetaceae bacterium]|nr:Si-specific NAD(P)(+) transhydrogenase [Spirochaetaceae bacterium]|tara:strand:- start:62187 stop:63596 length:1410 start_codon:yes stop_codon:yes gene_type:complete
MYDLIVIGSGPGGEGAAMKATKSGLRVAIVDLRKDPGGNCTHQGTIPSKALRQSMHNYVEFRRNPLFRNHLDQFTLELPELLNSARSVIRSQSEMRKDFYERNDVDRFTGFARFLDANTVQVESADTAPRKLQGKNFVIASGSRPYRPENLDFSHPLIRDSDTILEMEKTPRIITIYGAGVIGCEYASIFRNMGMKVNLINTRDKLLSFLDDEIIDALSYHLRQQGVLIRHNEEFESMRFEATDEDRSGEGDAVIVTLKSGKEIKSDVLFWANGRSGNTRDMGLESLGLEIDHRGYVQVNEFYVSSQSHIYAVGDVVGYPSLASASYDQGRAAVSHLIGEDLPPLLPEKIPTGIYTSPEISSLGKTERELTEQKVPYEVGHAFFKSLARAQITGYNVGMLKLLFHRETMALLGIHCFGYQAAEILHIGQAIMEQPGAGNNIRYFVHTTFNYPTMAEAYRVAALNGLNRL